MNKCIMGLVLIAVGIIASLFTYPLIGITKFEKLPTKLENGQKIRVIGSVYEVGQKEIPVMSDFLTNSLDAKLFSLQEDKNVLILTSYTNVHSNEKILINGYVLKIPFSDITLIIGNRVGNIAKMIFDDKSLRFEPARVKKVPGIEFYVSIAVALAGFVLFILGLLERKRHSSHTATVPSVL